MLLLGCFGITLLPILLLNLLLGEQTLGRNDKVMRASQWQQTTGGVTYAPTLSDTGPFKRARLQDRLPQVNTIVFGSSTMLGVTEGMFPPPLRPYNFAQTGHGLMSVIGEAEWMLAHAENVKYLVIPLDWSLGFVYQPGEPPAADLSPAANPPQGSAVAIPLLDRLRDALSYPRIESLLEILGHIAHTDKRWAAFRQYFLQDASDDYRCADGSWGKDFDTIHRGTCTGFRFDGSATFANSEPVRNAQPLLLAATASSSKYVTNLMQQRGEPNPVILRHLAAIARQAESNGGKLLLLMPPLLPGMEAAFLNNPQLAPTLAHTKDVLRAWAGANHVVILDAGAAERYGCTADEFIDEHHALPSCYGKIFHVFWSSHAHSGHGSLTWPQPGLYRM